MIASNDVISAYAQTAALEAKDSNRCKAVDLSNGMFSELEVILTQRSYIRRYIASTKEKAQRVRLG